MSIQLVSISHKTAPVAMREKFAFSPEQQLEIMKSVILESPAEECVILATCNRTEVYTYCAKEGKERKVFEVIQRVLSEAAGMPDGHYPWWNRCDHRRRKTREKSDRSAETCQLRGACGRSSGTAASGIRRNEPDLCLL